MAKSPYEIRLDVLKLAQDMLNKEQEVVKPVYTTQMSTSGYAEIQPNMYTTNSLLSLSRTLYDFVENKTGELK